jgi:flagellar motility protein MotE (MotC chaperone)
VLDSEQDSVDLATAAGLLGLAAETIRKRLQRGKIKGFKTPDGAWRVVLDKQDNSGQAAGQEQDKPGQSDAPLIAALREDIQFLRSQLQARDEEIRRVHVLLQQEQQQEQQQVKALTDQREQARRPWWRRLIGR